MTWKRTKYWFPPSIFFIWSIPNILSVQKSLYNIEKKFCNFFFVATTKNKLQIFFSILYKLFWTDRMSEIYHIKKIDGVINQKTVFDPTLPENLIPPEGWVLIPTHRKKIFQVSVFRFRNRPTPTVEILKRKALFSTIFLRIYVYFFSIFDILENFSKDLRLFFLYFWHFGNFS